MKRIGGRNVRIVLIGAMSVGWGISAGPQARHEVTVQETLSVKDEVATAVSRWQKVTGVEITPEARNLIQQGFSGQQNFLGMAFKKQALKQAEQQRLTDALVEHYLYDLRDLKLSVRRPSIAPERPMKFFDPRPPQSSVRTLTIDADDVRTYPPQKFVETMRKTLEDRVGFLDVISDPDTASIAIDNESKEEITCRTFVASPGQHTVKVLKEGTRVNCEERVNVDPQKTTTVPCPKGQIIRCRPPGK